MRTETVRLDELDADIVVSIPENYLEAGPILRGMRKISFDREKDPPEIIEEREAMGDQYRLDLTLQYGRIEGVDIASLPLGYQILVVEIVSGTLLGALAPPNEQPGKA